MLVPWGVSFATTMALPPLGGLCERVFPTPDKVVPAAIAVGIEEADGVFRGHLAIELCSEVERRNRDRIEEQPDVVDVRLVRKSCSRLRERMGADRGSSGRRARVGDALNGALHR